MFVDLPPCPIGPVATKFCKKCGVEKPPCDFHNSKANPGGKQYKCKICSLEDSAAWHVKNRDARAVYSAKRYRIPAIRNRRIEQSINRQVNVKVRARTLVVAAKLRMPEGFSLTIERVTECIENGNCSVTGIPFDLRNGESRRSGKRCNPFAPSIDRIDSNQGYTNDNSRVVIWQFNHMKGELTDMELFAVCQKIVSSMR